LVCFYWNILGHLQACSFKSLIIFNLNRYWEKICDVIENYLLTHLTFRKFKRHIIISLIQFIEKLFCDYNFTNIIWSCIKKNKFCIYSILFYRFQSFFPDFCQITTLSLMMS
jgi:hypothetical protein